MYSLNERIMFMTIIWSILFQFSNRVLFHNFQMPQKTRKGMCLSFGSCKNQFFIFSSIEVKFQMLSIFRKFVISVQIFLVIGHPTKRCVVVSSFFKQRLQVVGPIPPLFWKFTQWVCSHWDTSTWNKSILVGIFNFHIAWNHHFLSSKLFKYKMD